MKNIARLVSKECGFGGDVYIYNLQPPIHHNKDMVETVSVDMGWGLLMPSKAVIFKHVGNKYVSMVMVEAHNMGLDVADILRLIKYEIVDE